MRVSQEAVVEIVAMPEDRNFSDEEWAHFEVALLASYNYAHRSIGRI